MELQLQRGPLINKLLVCAATSTPRKTSSCATVDNVNKFAERVSFSSLRSVANCQVRGQNKTTFSIFSSSLLHILTFLSKPPHSSPPPSSEPPHTCLTRLFRSVLFSSIHARPDMMHGLCLIIEMLNKYLQMADPSSSRRPASRHSD